jgi:hypothetical protein
MTLLPAWKSALLVFIMMFSFFTVGVFADDQSLGRVRIASFVGPRQVAPDTAFSLSLDVEYEVRVATTIRAAIFAGLLNVGASLWQSDNASVAGGGDKVWTINLTAPSVEGTIQFSSYAYYLDSGVWKFYNDTVLGPGYAQVTIKVSRYATLRVDLGVAGLAVTLGNSSDTTSQVGDLNATLLVGMPYQLSVPSDQEYQNSTRIVFSGWQDGNNQTQRLVSLTGDTQLVGYYRVQYLLKVTSSQSGYSYQKWYGAGSNATLQEVNFVPTSFPLALFGGKYVFSGWSGDVNSPSGEISFTMNSPKTIYANFSIDYGLLIFAIFAIIIALGIIGEVILLALKRRKRIETTLRSSTKRATCPYCGEDVEEEWVHCIHCGNNLGSLEDAVTK